MQLSGTLPHTIHANLMLLQNREIACIYLLVEEQNWEEVDTFYLHSRAWLLNVYVWKCSVGSSISLYLLMHQKSILGLDVTFNRRYLCTHTSNKMTRPSAECPFISMLIHFTFNMGLWTYPINLFFTNLKGITSTALISIVIDITVSLCISSTHFFSMRWSLLQWSVHIHSQFFFLIWSDSYVIMWNHLTSKG